MKRRDFIQYASAASAMSLPMAAAASESGVAASYDPMKPSFGPKPTVSGEAGLAITTHPLATEAAVEVLREGGNACDGALAAAMTQTVVEPHMTTLTGMLSMLYHEAGTGKSYYLNGSMNAPLAPLGGLAPGDERTGRAVAVPGFWAAFEAAQQRFGSMPVKRLMAPAIEHAENGIEVYPFLFGDIYMQHQKFGWNPEACEIFMPNGVLPSQGDTLVQQRAADTLRRLSEEGSDYFYHGAFARQFSEAVQARGGVITEKDFEAYAVRWDDPVEGSYQGHKVLAARPPDNGGAHLVEILNLFELLDLPSLGHLTESPEALHQMMLIVRQVIEDGARQRDPATYPVPLDVILSKDYARMRLELLRMDVPRRDVPPPPTPGSNHLTVVDREGNVATVLHSLLSDAWENGIFVDGISVCAAGVWFGRVMPPPGGRISVFVCPNMVFNGNRMWLASGSPSTGLLSNIAINLSNVIDFGMPVAESVVMPRFGGMSSLGGGRLMIEASVPEAVRNEVERRGMPMEVVNPWNMYHGSFEAIEVNAAGVRSATGDPRRNAVAMAE